MDSKDDFGEVDHDASASDDVQSGSQDAREMANLGKKQQLQRNFTFWSTLGFSCVTMITWEGELSTFVLGLQNGGPLGLIVGFLVIWTGYAAVNASLCEMMSMWPTSGGQYHWSYTMAPRRWAPFISYISGWQSIIAWQAVVPSAGYLTGTMIQGLIVLNNPDYHFERWHGTLIMFAVLFFCLFVNTLLARWLPNVESLALALHIFGFIAILVVITVMSPQKASPHDVFQVMFNQGGWPTQGVSFFVGIQGIMFAWLGADGAIHMSEEIQNASTVLPWSLMGSVVINGVLGFSMLIAVLFCGGDLFSALSSPTGYPFEAIFTFASRSVAGGTGLSSIVVVMALCATLTSLTASSRELWAFARDHGVPGSTILMRVHKPTGLPLWSLSLCTTVSLLMSLINIGSSVALNAIISLTVAGFLGSYVIPLTLILYRRVQAVRNKTMDLPWGPWILGKWSGIVINSYALVWSVVILFWSFWPADISPSVKTMNWSCLAWGSIMIFALLFWLIDGRKRYKGPVRDAVGGEIDDVIGWDQVDK